MKFNHGIASEICRWILFVFLFIIFGGMFVAAAVLMFHDGYYLPGVFMQVFVLFWWWLLAVGFHSMASVTLSEDGVYFRVYFKTKFYPWKEIIQTGVLWSKNKGGWYNDLVLVPITGSPHTPQDKYFRRHNMFRLIHLPYTQEVLAYLQQYHGPLDFDFSDGKEK